MNTERSAVVIGRGGQGTKLAAHVIAQAGANDGLLPLCYSVYDGLIRGGNIASTVVLATDDPGVPVRSSFDVLVAAHDGWFDRFYDRVVPGGVVFIDPAYVPHDRCTRHDVRHVAVDFSALARAAGDGRSGNMAAAGVVCGHWGVPSQAALDRAVESMVPAHRQDRVAANLACLRAGWEFGSDD